MNKHFKTNFESIFCFAQWFYGMQLSDVYRWWQLPYFYAGIKCYDLVSGRQLLKSSYILSKSKALELFPMLKKDKLVGALVYYDGE